MENLYNVTTSILTKGNVTLSVNIIAENLADAISNVSYLKYNGKAIRPNITGAKCIATNIIRNYWSVEDLNPNYKGSLENKEEGTDTNSPDTNSPDVNPFDVNK